MKKVLMLRRNPSSPTDGTVNYCKALYELFKGDSEINVLDIKDYPTHRSLLFKYYYRHAPLCNEIAHADVVHVNGYTAMGVVQAVLWAGKAKKRVVYTAHWHPFETLSHPMLGKLFFNTIVRPVIRRYVDVVVAINDEDYRFFSKLHSNVVKIPHWYKPRNKAVASARQSKMLLFVGRADDEVKGFRQLYSLPEGMYDIHCVGSGTMPHRRDFTQHADVADAELIRLYSEAALVVVPSKYEAFSYVALEALSYGTPVVMSDRVRIADHLKGVEGYAVYRYGDEKDFLAKIQQTIGIEVDTDAVSRIFNIQRIKEHYAKVYNP